MMACRPIYQCLYQCFIRLTYRGGGGRGWMAAGEWGTAY